MEKKIEYLPIKSNENDAEEEKLSFIGTTEIFKGKYEKQILNTVDKGISIAIMTPLVVACWRGIWNLMEYYTYYFPHWESYLIGAACHIILASAQHVLHHVFIEKRKKYHWFFILGFTKLYTYIFTVITNMNWRGCWNLHDYYLGIELDKGIARLDDWPHFWRVFSIFAGSVLCLGALKCLKNTVAPPFAVAMDHKEEMFLFPTRFKSDIKTYFQNHTETDCEKSINIPAKMQSGTSNIVSSDFGLFKEKQFKKHLNPVKCISVSVVIIFLIAVIYIIVTQWSTKSSTDSPINERDLIVAESITRELIQPPSNARPFGIDLHGPVPQQFLTTTEKSTLNYPQLSNYRNRYYPKNIQDIIGYIGGSKKRSKQIEIDPEKSSQDATINQENLTSGSAFTKTDPFHSYKPQDPSDINLLATASFRFAPPVWSKLRNHFPKYASHHLNHQQVDNSNIQEIINRHTRPIVLTLNIYPMDDAQHRYEHKRGFAFPYRFMNADPRKNIKGNKMTIHLNVYPDQEDHGEESKIKEQNVVYKKV